MEMNFEVSGSVWKFLFSLFLDIITILLIGWCFKDAALGYYMHDFWKVGLNLSIVTYAILNYFK